jgi:hypothetical protein
MLMLLPMPPLDALWAAFQATPLRRRLVGRMVVCLGIIWWRPRTRACPERRSEWFRQSSVLELWLGPSNVIDDHARADISQCADGLTISTLVDGPEREGRPAPGRERFRASPAFTAVAAASTSTKGSPLSVTNKGSEPR